MQSHHLSQALTAAFVAMVLLTGCTGETDDKASDATAEATTTTSIRAARSTTTQVPVRVELEPLQQLWFDAGASWELANCYTVVFDDAGFADAADFEAISSAQQSLQGADLEAFVECNDHYKPR